MNRPTLAWAALLLLGCTTETQKMLDSWYGVYLLETHTEATEGCDNEQLDIPKEPEFFELEAVEGEEANLLELRVCPNKDPRDCANNWFLNGITDVANATRITTEWGDYIFTVAAADGITCYANYTTMDITRAGEAADDIEIVLKNHSGFDENVRTEDECLDFLDLVAKDEDACDVQRTMKATRVE